ncbi:ABC transporter, permease protein [Xanthomonas bromi]|uniref:Transport permease protein n=1 Tax=Xanthomonas bromi TaxID=56449 RepID=A0A1C3NFP1_9XANT|nr:ABC transporter permease [Xanthomonas bromi]SBV49239.1 ABC transporter, permease protein [Xanthomonas bromi]
MTRTLLGRGRLTRLVLGPFDALTERRDLTLELSKREVLGRYRGASFGLLWSLISPFLLLIVYTIAFGSIMKSRWPQVAEGQAHFSLVLFVGLIVHGFFAECLSRSPYLIMGNPNFVKRVIFPLEILPWPMVASALFHVLMNTVVFALLRLAMDGQISWTILLLPVVLLPLVVLGLGVSWFLASLGVYFRDITQVTGVLSTALLFLSSAMIPEQAIPQSFELIFKLNPLTFIIDQAREVALWGNLPDFIGLAIYMCIAIIVFYAGFAWFKATRRGFADVI